MGQGPLTALRSVVDHPRLASPALRVFFYIVGDLSGREYRAVKQVPIARALRLSQQQVSKALTVLVDIHYLQIGPRDGPANTYRLNLTTSAVHDLYNSAVYNGIV
jgi:hypothetical protein